MKKSGIKYNFNLSSDYRAPGGARGLGVSIFEARKAVSEIFDNLLKVKRVQEASCLFGQKFDTLSFDILFVSDKKIHKINREYRRKDCPTDVITFALFADDDFKVITNNDIYLGEIIISLDTASAQAKGSVQEEVLTLIAHGLLHLLGFDHQIEEDYRFVTKTQEEAISQYHPGQQGRGCRLNQ